MTQREHNQRYEAKRKAAGYVRGPRITAEAAEKLRVLSYETGLTPCALVSRLLAEAGEKDSRVRSAMREHNLSESEARYVVENGIAA